MVGAGRSKPNVLRQLYGTTTNRVIITVTVFKCMKYVSQLDMVFAYQAKVFNSSTYGGLGGCLVEYSMLHYGVVCYIIHTCAYSYKTYSNRYKQLQIDDMSWEDMWTA